MPERDILDAAFPPGSYPSQVTVFCDRCGIEHSGDYLVSEDDDQQTRFGYARRHMRTYLGWNCDENGDWCPECWAVVRMSK